MNDIAAVARRIVHTRTLLWMLFALTIVTLAFQ